MPRLPQPGGDKGDWGVILNEFLSEAHQPDGSLKPIAQNQVVGLSTQLANKANTADVTTAIEGAIEPIQTQLDTLESNLSPSVNKAASALLKARTALALGNCNILFGPGDSITEGQTASNEAHRWSVILTQRLRSTYQASGLNGGEGYVPSYYEAPNLTDAWVRTPGAGTITEGSAWGLGFRRLVLSAGNYTTQWVQRSFVGTGIDLFFIGSTSTGTARIEIDGALQGTFVTTDSAVVDGKRYSVRGLSSGSHTVRVARDTSGTGNQILFAGGFFYDGDEVSGIRRWDHSRAGAATNTFASATDYTSPYIGYIQPDLVLINLGANDVNSGVSIATYKANLNTMVTRLNTNSTIPPSIILTSGWPRISNSANPAPSIAAWEPYRVALAEIASAYPNVILFDIWKAFGNTVYGADPIGLYSDGVHLSDKGEALYSSSLREFIVNSGI